MGMFDMIYVPRELLPLASEEQNKFKDIHEFQTKSFSNSLDVYTIKDRKLFVFPARGGLSNNDHLEKKEILLDKVHRYINFYTDINKIWYEFYAKFTDGILEKIVTYADMPQDFSESAW